MGFPSFYTLPSILFIALPVDPGKRLTALGVNMAPNEGCRPASDACPPGRVLRRGLGLSSPRVLLEGPRDAPRSLSGSVHRPRSFLCVARGRKRSSLCLSDVMGGANGGATPPPIARRRNVTREGRLPLSRSPHRLRARLLRNHVCFTGKARRPRASPSCSRACALNTPSGDPFSTKEPPYPGEALASHGLGFSRKQLSLAHYY
jgi:hypothetical protein